MGCDIHAHVEQRIGGTWTKISFAAPTSRNYDAFAILAGVRNGFGFAGIPTGSGYNPIAPKRGLPHDVSTDVYEDSESWGGDGHSHSWLTLREIFEYDYTQTTRHEGVLSLKSFQDFDYRRSHPNVWLNPQPEEYSARVIGGLTRTVFPEEARDILKSMSNEDVCASNVYVRETWNRRYLDDFADYLVALVPLIRFGLDDVRLVFWFDN